MLTDRHANRRVDPGSPAEGSLVSGNSRLWSRSTFSRRASSLLLGLAFAWLGWGCVPAAVIDEGHPLTRDVKLGLKSGKDTFSHTEFDRFMRKHVDSKGLFDYAGAKKDRKDLDAYLGRLEKAPIAKLSKNELFAILMNAYNAYTLDLMLRNYPLETIKKIDKPWKQEICVVGGHTVSLDFIEHSLLRPQELFGDPRLHFGVNCASKGCPPLWAGAFNGKDVDKQLEATTRTTLNRSDYLGVKDGKVYTTEILSWFKEDFIKRHGSVSKFLIRYAPSAAKAILEAKGDKAIEFFSYDWSINDSKKSAMRK